MTKLEQNYELFLTSIEAEDVDFINKINATMLHDNYACKIEHKKTLSVITYTNRKNKKVIAKVALTKGVLTVKIVGHNVASYEPFLKELPSSMREDIKKSPECKQLIDPSACWQACEMGSVFQLDGEKFGKCRYHCFSFDVDSDNKIVIVSFLNMERKFQP